MKNTLVSPKLKILLGKLKHYGIRGEAHGYFESYFKDRNNMFQSMDIILNICHFLLLFHNALFLDLFTSMI